MSFSIQTNVGSMTALDHLRINDKFQQQTIERLTSGYRINSSGDDAAGLAVANNYRSAVAELNQGVRNANDGVSTLQIVDGGLNNISKILDRLRTLATQSASTTFTGDRGTLNQEFTRLLTEIDRQASNIGLATAAATPGGESINNSMIGVYIGGGSDAANSKVLVDLSGAANIVDSKGLKIDALTITGATTAAAITNADAALAALKTATAGLGLVQGAVGTGENTLAYAINLASSQIVSYSAAESRVRDADIATEASNLTKAQVLQQSSMAALAQANSSPQSVLSLFR
jgi:flagellin